MRSISNSRSVYALAAAAAAALAFSGGARAASYTYDGNGNQSASSLWDSAVNWNPDGIPGSNAAVADVANMVANLTTLNRATTFANPGPVDVSAFGVPNAYRLSQLNFDNASAGQTTIGSSPEAIASLVFDNGGAGTAINVNGTYTGASANAVAIRVHVVLQEQLVANVTPRANGAITLNFLAGTGTEQHIVGPGGITKNGLGVMSFADYPKAFTGPLIVNDGRVRMQGAVANAGGLTGTSAVTVNAAGPNHLVAGLLNVPEGGQIQFDTAGTGTNHFGPSSGASTVVTLNGGGMFDTQFNSGLIGAIRTETNRITTMNNAVVLASNSIISAAANVNAFNSSLTLNGVVSGPGMLISNDHNGGFSGTLVLAGNNTYTGGTMVNNGTLTVTHANGLGPSTNPLIVNNINATQTATPNSTVTVNLFSGGPTTVGSLSGTINATPGTNTATINAGANQFTVNQTTAGTYQGQIAGTGGFRLGSLSTNTLTLSANQSYTGGTTVQAGKLRVTRMHAGNGVTISGGTLEIMESSPGVSSGHPAGNNAFVSQPSSLSISGTGTLDITNNDVILDYTGSSPVATYEALVASGYNVTGDWQGDGIVSSIAANDGNYVVAIADNAALAAPFGTANGGPLFSGVDVDLDTVLIKFTHRADINLDGIITPDDSAVFGGNYDENQPAVWATGDMNYDGIFTPDDAAIFGGAYDESLASLPEPGSLGVLALLGLGLARRQRRQA